ncbi:Meiotic Sister-Chromatid recombination aldehyde dehydrogenase, partial [Tulasnella sp. 408]
MWEYFSPVHPEGGINLPFLFTTSFAIGIVVVWRRYVDMQSRAVPFTWAAPEPSFLNWTSVNIQSPALTSHTVDPSLLPPNHIQGKKYITCYDPSNGLHIATIPADAEIDINIKIDAAKHAFEAWKTSSFQARKRVIRSLLAWILVVCYPEEAEALTTSPDIKHITFIGSETVGKKVAQAATVNLTPTVLELGGKDPAIILPNTNLEKYASMWMRGVFQANGQNCIGIERFIVPVELHDRFLDMMTARIAKLRLGSVLSSSADGFVSVVDNGSMISDARFEELERLIKAAERDGAEIVTGGERWQHAYHENGAYFEPTLIGHVNENMEIAQTEVFAPIMLVIPYDTVDEAVAIANGSRYGLGASVWGPDQRECVAVGRLLECGMVSVNDFGVFYLNQDLPFGGVKSSGYGRFGGPEGLRGLTNPKAVVEDRFPWLVQTSIPRTLDYPVRSLVQSWEFLSGMLDVLYADSWKAKIL